MDYTKFKLRQFANAKMWIDGRVYRGFTYTRDIPLLKVKYSNMLENIISKEEIILNWECKYQSTVEYDDSYNLILNITNWLVDERDIFNVQFLTYKDLEKDVINDKITNINWMNGQGTYFFNKLEWLNDPLIKKMQREFKLYKLNNYEI